MHEVFISYSRKDRQNATIVMSVLEQNGIKCWIDYRDGLAGNDYAASIVRAIKASKIMVLVLSSNSCASSHVLREVNSAVSACVTIIPFKIDNTQINDSMEYYLGKTHWLEALTPPIESHINKLVETIRKYNLPNTVVDAAANTPNVHHTGAGKYVCRMAKFQDLLEVGYTASKIAIQLVENDYINCNGIGLANEGTAEQWEQFLQNNTETFQYLVNGENQIVGDWSMVALSDELYEKAIRGDLLEQEINLNSTELLFFPGVYHGYILAISILPEYRSIKNYNLLIDSFFEQLEELSSNGIFFDKWCINVFSMEVESLVKQLGFRYVCDNREFGKMYVCDFMPLPKIPLLKKYKKLVENYADK